MKCSPWVEKHLEIKKERHGLFKSSWNIAASSQNKLSYKNSTCLLFAKVTEFLEIFWSLQHYQMKKHPIPFPCTVYELFYVYENRKNAGSSVSKTISNLSDCNISKNLHLVFPIGLDTWFILEAITTCRSESNRSFIPCNYTNYSGEVPPINEVMYQVTIWNGSSNSSISAKLLNDFCNRNYVGIKFPI